MSNLFAALTATGGAMTVTFNTARTVLVLVESEKHAPTKEKTMGANEKHDATYHGREYTPTTDELRDIWVDYNLNPLPRSQGIPLVETAQADFDRWLATVRAEAKAEALTDMAHVLEADIPGHAHENGQIIAGRNIIRIIQARANQYKEAPNA